MLRLLKSSKSIQSYQDYYTAFPDTDSVNDLEIKNNHVAIKNHTDKVDFLVVDGRGLINTKNTNLLPFVSRDLSNTKGGPIVPAYSQKILISVISENLAQWLVVVLNYMPALRTIVINFGTSNEVPLDTEFNSFEILVDSNNLKQAPPIIYYHIFYGAIEWIISNIEKLSLQYDVKIIGQFGGKNEAPLVLDIVVKEDSTIVHDISGGYNPSVEYIMPSEWLVRYMNTGDTVGFFADMFGIKDMDFFKTPLIYTTDEMCYSPLTRLLLENKSITSVHVFLFSDMLDNIYCDLKTSNKILFNKLLKHGITGSGAQLLSDIFLLDTISEFYSDIGTELDEFRDVRKGMSGKSFPIFDVKWVGMLDISRDNERLGSLAKLIDTKIRSWDVIRSRIGMCLFMADMSVILETPSTPSPELKSHEFRDQIKSSLITWMIINKTLFDITFRQSFDSESHKAEIFFAVIEGILDLLPALQNKWGESIQTISDVVDFIKASQDSDAVHVRKILSGNKYKKMIESSLDSDIEVSSGDDEQDDTQAQAQNYTMIVQFLTEYDNYWSNELWTNRDVLSKLYFYKYSERIGNKLRPMFTRMGKKRLEYLIRENLMIKETTRFNIEHGLSPKSIPETITSRVERQIFRKYPVYWTDSIVAKKNITSLDPNTYSSVETETMKSNLIPNSIHNLDNIPDNLPDRLKEYFTGHKDFELLNKIKNLVPKYVNAQEKQRVETELEPTKLIDDRSTPFGNNWSLVYDTCAIATKGEWPFDSTETIGLILLTLFCTNVPMDYFSKSFKSLRWTDTTLEPIVLTYILEKSKIDMNDLSVYTLAKICSKVANIQATWPGGDNRTAVNLYRLINIVHRFCFNTEHRKLIHIADQFRDVSGGTEQFEVFVTMIEDMSEEAGFDSLFKDSMNIIINASKLLKYDRLHNMISDIISTFLKANANRGVYTEKTGEYFVRVLEYMDNRVKLKTAKNNRAYKICSDFSFDPYQPSDNVYLKRLYAVSQNYSDSMQDDFRNDQFCDFEGEFINIHRSIRKNNAGIPPTGANVVLDPLDSKFYYCLEWDIKEIESTNEYQEIIFTLNRFGTDATENTVRAAVETHAAAWWLSVPHIRAKIHKRANGDDWNHTRWLVWMLRMYSKELWLPKINPIQYAVNRFKIFSVPFDSITLPSGDLFSEEFGIPLVSRDNVSIILKLIDTVFVNLNFKYSSSTISDKQLGKKIPEHRLVESYAESKYDIEPNMHGVDLLNQKRENDLKCLIIDGYMNPISPDKTNEYKSLTQCFVMLPKIHEFVNYNVSDGDFSPGDKVEYFKKQTVEITGENDRELGIDEYKTFVQRYSVSLASRDVDNKKIKKFTNAVLAKLPMFYGISFVFYIYTRVKRKYYVGGNQVTYQKFLDDRKMLDKYTVVTEYEKNSAEVTKITFIGVLGNTIDRDRMVSLFSYANTISDYRLNKEDQISSIVDMTQMSLITRKETRNRLLKFIQKLQQARRNSEYSTVFLRKKSDAVALDLDQIHSVDLGYQKINGFVFGVSTSGSKFIKGMSKSLEEWHTNINTPDYIFLGETENPVTINSNIRTSEHITVPNISNLTLYSGPYDSVALYSTNRYRGVTTAEVVKDIVNILESLALCVKSYKAHKKLRLKDVMFLSIVLTGYKYLEYILYIRSLPMFFFKSDKLIAEFFEYITERRLEDQLPDLTDVLNSINGLLYIHDEDTSQKLLDSITSEKITEQSLDLEDVQYQSSYIRPLLENMDSEIDERIKYLFSDPSTLQISKMQAKLIDSVPRKQLMRSVIRKLKEGRYSFPTTTRDYTNLGIFVGSSVADEATLWEEIEAVFEEHYPLVLTFFKDADHCDVKLDALDKEIKSGNIKGAVLYKKKQKMEKKIRKLEEGRRVMMYIYENNVTDPESNDGFIMFLYRLEELRHSDDKITVTTGVSKFEMELEYRGRLSRRLERDGLRLIFSGKYEQKDGKETKQARENFKNGWTIYIKPNDKRERSTLSSLLASIYSVIKNQQPTDYYMQYLTMGDIQQLYATTEIKTHTGSKLLSSIIDLRDAEVIFSDKYKMTIAKTTDLLSKYITKQFDAFVSIHVFRVTKNGLVRSEVVNVTQDVNKNTENTFFFMFITRKSKRGEFFEPLIVLQ